MTNNKHYFINKETGSYVYLLNIGYNNITNKVELQSLKTSLIIFNSNEYSFPLDEYNKPIISWEKYLYLYDNATYVHITVWPVFEILDNIFQQAIGFTNGYYPSNIISVVVDTNNTLNNDGESISQGYDNDTISSSSFVPGLLPPYVTIYYKPNNPQFAQQGAVSASSHTARERYNSITNNTAKYRNAYGLSVANALAYGVPENGYTIKDKIGYPNIQTPVISKYSGKLKKC